jgi:hypothetical protein
MPMLLPQRAHILDPTIVTIEHTPVFTEYNFVTLISHATYEQRVYHADREMMHHTYHMGSVCMLHEASSQCKPRTLMTTHGHKTA